MFVFLGARLGHHVWTFIGPKGERSEELGQDKKKKGSGQRPSKDGEGKDGNMGSALRSVYQQTVEEKIPDDLLDLLGKLN